MTTGTLKFVDASTPSTISGGPYDGTCYYLGGDTPHVWTKPELDARPERYRLGIWVRSNPIGVAQAMTDAVHCLAQLAFMGQPKDTLVCIDMETAEDPTYVAAFSANILSGGYKLIAYGTQDDVFGNDNPDGLYFGAQWTGVSHIASGDQMTQYVSFTGYDVDLAEASLALWDTKPVVANFPQPKTLEDHVIVLNNLTVNGPAVVLPVPVGTTKVLFYADEGWRVVTPPEIRLGFAPGNFGGRSVLPTWNAPISVGVPVGATRLTVARLDTGETPVTIAFA
jgi:hypothetical protein